MIIRARYALLAPGELRTDVRVEFDGERIVAVTSGYLPGSPKADVDFGAAVITPGFVNPHTHLELEFCAGKLDGSREFLLWLQQIRDMKAARGGQAESFPRKSMLELLASGCTTVVDHYTCDIDAEPLGALGPRYVPLRECFQFNNHAPDAEAIRASSVGGWAPHAPYTVSLEVAQACRRLSDGRNLPLSTHLAEIPAEIEFMRDGRNEQIETLLRAADALDADWRGTGMSPIRWYAEQGILNSRTYVIHANYPQEGDIETLAAANPTIVFCPSTHAHFGHPRHSIREFLDAGIPVALGTDSLASNAALSPLREAAAVRRDYPEISAAEVFAAVTTRALGPLNWDGCLGRLEPGFLADLAVYRLDGAPPPQFDAVFDAVIAAGMAEAVWVGGKQRWERGSGALAA